jgi:hypothetical protein
MIHTILTLEDLLPEKSQFLATRAFTALKVNHQLTQSIKLLLTLADFCSTGSWSIDRHRLSCQSLWEWY